MQEHSLFSTPSPAFIVCRLFDDGHSDWCEVTSHCSFDLHFSNNEWDWASFHLFVSYLYIFFGEMSVQVFFPLFDCLLLLLFVCFSGIELYELLAYFGNLSFVSCFICYYFLPFWGLSFHLAYSFLCCAKVLKLNQVPLVYFCFYFHYSKRWVIEDLALINVIRCSAYILPWEFYSFWSYI